MSGGTGLAQRTIFGNLAGLLVHGAALAAGLSALLVASAVAYSTVKLAGAGYLLCLGVQALRASRRPAAERPAAGRVPAGIAVPRLAFLAGLVWLSAYAHLVHRARGLLTGPRVKAWLERTTGAVLIAFGLRVAVERR